MERKKRKTLFRIGELILAQPVKADVENIFSHR
jgi:hypothetical protein